MGIRRLAPLAAVGFVFAIIGVFVGREIVVPLKPVETELHDLVHHDLELSSSQAAQLAEIEKHFAVRRRALELELRADNAQLADAIQSERGNGPKVAAAIDRSHQAMGALQKETLEHIFAMRSILTPAQAARFDEAIVKALTGKEQ